MRREERVTVQGPAKEQQPDGMSHRGVRHTNPPRSARPTPRAMEKHIPDRNYAEIFMICGGTTQPSLRPCANQTAAPNPPIPQGKTPAFDIWGQTVNLASRMQTTGEPGRIQISELMYERVTADPESRFTFERAHKAYAKGFGTIQAYFVEGSQEPPPKALLQSLGLEPYYGPFFHDNPIMGATPSQPRPARPGSASSAGSQSPTTPMLVNGHVHRML